MLTQPRLRYVRFRKLGKRPDMFRAMTKTRLNADLRLSKMPSAAYKKNNGIAPSQRLWIALIHLLLHLRPASQNSKSKKLPLQLQVRLLMFLS